MITKENSLNKDKQKTFTERFQELEQQVMQLVNLYQDVSQAFNALVPIIQDVANQNRLLNEQLQAVYDLSESKQSVTREAVSELITKKRVAQIETILKQDEEKGLIKKIESVETPNDIVVYSSDAVALAFKAASLFESDGVKLEDLLGKKSGDKVASFTIKEVYRIVQTNQESQQETSNEVKKE